MARGILEGQLGFQPLEDLGQRSVDGLRLLADLNDGDTITISDGVTPEVFTARTGPTGLVPYEFTRGAGAPATLANFVDEVNNGTVSVVPSVLARAGDLKGDCCGLVGLDLVTALTLAENTVGARCAVFNVNFEHLETAADHEITGSVHTMQAEEITAIDPAAAAGAVVIGSVNSATQPQLIGWGVRDATHDVVAAVDVRLQFEQHPAATGRWVLVLSESGAAAVLLAGDLVSWSARVTS